jgi:hypothetical protein
LALQQPPARPFVHTGGGGALAFAKAQQEAQAAAFESHGHAHPALSPVPEGASPYSTLTPLYGLSGRPFSQSMPVQYELTAMQGSPASAADPLQDRADSSESVATMQRGEKMRSPTSLTSTVDATATSSPSVSDVPTAAAASSSSGTAAAAPSQQRRPVQIHRSLGTRLSDGRRKWSAPTTGATTPTSPVQPSSDAAQTYPPPSQQQQ